MKLNAQHQLTSLEIIQTITRKFKTRIFSQVLIIFKDFKIVLLGTFKTPLQTLLENSIQFNKYYVYLKTLFKKGKDNDLITYNNFLN